MGRRTKDFVRWPAFHHAAIVHHRDLIRGVGNDAHVMGDQDHTDLALICKLLDQVEHLRLNRNIQSRGRLIGDNHSRLRAQSKRDHHTLAHAAGKLVGVLVKPNGRVWDRHTIQKRDGPLFGVRCGKPKMQLDRLNQLLTHCEERVERGERILKDHPDLFAANAALFLVAQLINASPIEMHLTGVNAGRRIKQPDDRIPSHGFARAAFPNNPSDFARPDVIADLFHRAEDAVPGWDFDGQVSN